MIMVEKHFPLLDVEVGRIDPIGCWEVLTTTTTTTAAASLPCFYRCSLPSFHQEYSPASSFLHSSSSLETMTKKCQIHHHCWRNNAMMMMMDVVVVMKVRRSHCTTASGSGQRRQLAEASSLLLSTLREGSTIDRRQAGVGILPPNEEMARVSRRVVCWLLLYC